MEASARFIPSGGSPFAHLGPAAATAYNPAAPADEVSDAGAELFSIYHDPGPAVPMTDLVSQMMALRGAEDTGHRLLQKALAYKNPGSAEAKAETRAWNSRISGNGLWVPKPGLTFQTLRQLSQRVEVVRAIHNTMVSQVLRFAAPSQKDDAMGWRVQHQDPNAELSPEQEEFHQWLTGFLLCGGREFNALARRKNRRQGFRSFLAKLVEDSLTLDHVAVETVPLQGTAGLDSFYVRDGATFYFATEPDAQGEDSDGLYAYQVLTTGASPNREFNFEELTVFQRNLSSDCEWSNYGRSELESSVDTISLFLQALAHTREGIDSNAIPKGILTVFGQFDRRTQEAFKAAWSAQLRGVRNGWNLPVLFSHNGQAAAQFTSTGQPFSEMAFAKWIQLQTAVVCSIYGMDPAEIGMESFSAGGHSSLSGDDTEERLASSRAKGLGPLLSNISSFVSEDLLARFSDQARFGFTGLEVEDRKARKELQDRVSTINELRAGLQMPPHPLGWFGDLPADAGLMSAEFQRLQATLTWNEARKVWGGLDAFPDERVGLNPLNPSLGASWNQVVQSAAPPEDPQGMPGQDQQDPFGAMAPEGDPGQGEEDDEPGEWEGEDGEGDPGGDPGQESAGQESAGPGARETEVGRNLRGMR